MSSSVINSDYLAEPIIPQPSTSFLENHKSKLVTGVALLALSLLLVGGVLVYFNINALAGWTLISGGWVIGVADVIAGITMLGHQTLTVDSRRDGILSPRKSLDVATLSLLGRESLSRMECAKIILSKALDIDASLITLSISEEAKISPMEDKVIVIVDESPEVKMVRNQSAYAIHRELVDRVHNVLGVQLEVGHITFKIGEKTLFQAVEDYHFKTFSQERFNRLKGNQEQQLNIQGYQIRCEKSQIKTYGDLCLLIYGETRRCCFQLEDKLCGPQIIHYDHEKMIVTGTNHTDITNQQSIDFWDKSFVLVETRQVYGRHSW